MNDWLSFDIYYFIFVLVFWIAEQLQIYAYIYIGRIYIHGLYIHCVYIYIYIYILLIHDKTHNTWWLLWVIFKISTSHVQNADVWITHRLKKGYFWVIPILKRWKCVHYDRDSNTSLNSCQISSMLPLNHQASPLRYYM